MVDPSNTLIFSESPSVEFAGNRFVNVPVILQYDTTPLIEVVTQQKAGFTTQFSIFSKDGIYLAKVVGSRLVATEDGRKAGIELTFPDKMTVCKLGNQVLFEIRRKDAAVLKTEAELFTPDGRFLRAKGVPQEWLFEEKKLSVGGISMEGCEIRDCRIGIRLNSDGAVHIASM